MDYLKNIGNESQYLMRSYDVYTGDCTGLLESFESFFWRAFLAQAFAAKCICETSCLSEH